MKLMHTADWHIGHQLHGHDRTVEHAAFFDWLVGLLHQRAIDALLVAGDIFDTANPSAASWQLFYRFLARLRAELPALNVVIIGGNHDSPSKLDAPHELLRAFELHMIGAISRDADGALECDRLLVPLKRRDGSLGAICAAVPFLRSADLRLADIDDEVEDKLVAGVGEIYRQVIARARQRYPDLPLIAMGHAYLRQGQLSECSERKILGGNLHALPTEMFAGADYVALGHLHLAQSPAEKIHYSGSPLPLSMAEANYRHQVLELECMDQEIRLIERHMVPRTVPLLRIPEQPRALAQLESELAAMQWPACERERMPLLEVNVLLEKPEPRLRERIASLLADKPVRLARIATHYKGEQFGLADRLVQQQLAELTPEQVFELCHQRQFAAPPSDTLKAAFGELLAGIEEQAQ